MYIVDDICYAGTPDGEIEVVEAKPLEGGMLLLTFLSGEKRLFDTTTLDGMAFLPLRDADVFKTAKVEHGFVSWCDGEIDIAPEYVYENGIPYNEYDVLDRFDALMKSVDEQLDACDAPEPTLEDIVLA